jgi:hypothetical protein
MAIRQFLVRLHKVVERRFKWQVPARRRSAFVRTLPDQALAHEGGEDERLCQAALEVERDERLMVEMVEWDTTAGDGWDGVRPLL